MAFYYVPSQEQVTYIPDALTNYTETTSQFLIGDYNNTGFMRQSEPANLTVSQDTLPNGEWIFDADVSFGVLNTTIGTGNLSS